MIKLLLLFVGCVALNVGVHAQKNLEFIQEDLTFEINNDTFSLKGIYYIKSRETGQYPIAFPFPDKEIYSGPFDIRIINIKTGKKVEYHLNSDSSLMHFRVKVEDETPVLIQYKQKLHAQKASYVLLSTHAWGKPLEKANYKLVTSPGLKITNISYKPDTALFIDNRKIYFWEKQNFMPPCDFEFIYE